MDRRSHELACCVARQLGVGIKRYHVTDLTEQCFVSRFHYEACVSSAAQKPVKLLQLPSFSFPAHPFCFARIPKSPAVKKMKANWLSFAVTTIDFFDARSRNVEQLRVVRHFFRISVGKIAEQREVDMLILIGKKMYFESFQQLSDL